MDEEIYKNGGKRRRIGSNDDVFNRGRAKEDRLSSLPDAIVAEILSLLPIKSAAATSALSRQWRRLWTRINRLEFSSDTFPNSRSSDEFHGIFTTIDHIFRQLTSSEIRSFRLEFPFFPHTYQRDRCSSLVESWIRQICGRNAEEIEVSVGGYLDGPLISLPACVLECRSLVKLKLGVGISCILPVNGVISLNSLRNLSMYLYDSNRELMGKLFKSCPLLEDLDLSMYLDEDEHSLDISAPFLERLKITMKGCSRSSKIVINAPELKEIAIDSCCSPSYRFVENSSKLLKADIKSWHGRDRLRRRDQVLELLRGILSVRSLELCVGVFHLLHGHDEGVLPIFQNLTLLTISLYYTEDLNNLMPFLHCCPNLEALVLINDYPYNIAEGRNWVVLGCVPACLLTKLKRLEIKILRGSDKELAFLQFILSNANVLERLLVSVSECRDEDTGKLMDEDNKCENFDESVLCKELMFCRTLFNHPRSSSTCEIEFSGYYLSASSEDFKNEALDCRFKRFKNANSSAT